MIEVLFIAAAEIFAGDYLTPIPLNSNDNPYPIITSHNDMHDSGFAEHLYSDLSTAVSGVIRREYSEVNLQTINGSDNRSLVSAFKHIDSESNWYNVLCSVL